MAVSDKARKVLWAKSGNRCCICKQELVLDVPSEAGQSIVGEECHIHAQGARGPRATPGTSTDEIDSYENLILLCRVHHKLIDDCQDTFTPFILKKLKSEHEVWVANTLGGANSPALSEVQLRLLSEMENCSKSKVKGISLMLIDGVLGFYEPYLWNNHIHGALQANADDLTDVIAAVENLEQLGFLELHYCGHSLRQYRRSQRPVPTP